MPPVRYFGFKKETSFGEEATGSTFDIDVASAALDVPDDPNIEVPTLNRFQMKHIPGYYVPKGAVEYPIDIQTITHFLYFALGGYTCTEGTSGQKNTHELYATQSHVPHSFTARIGKDNFEHVFLGTVIDKLNLTVEDDVATMKMDMLAKMDKRATIRTDLTQPPGDLFPIAFYNAGTSINTMDISSDVKSWELEFSNGIKEDRGRGQGSRFPYYFEQGEGECTLTLKLRDDDSEILERFWGAIGSTEPGTTPHTPFSVTTTFNSGSYGTMTVKFPRCYFKKIDTSIKGADPREPGIEIGCEAEEVTLLDGTTKKVTPVYFKVENDLTSLIS